MVSDIWILFVLLNVYSNFFQNEQHEFIYVYYKSIYE